MIAGLFVGVIASVLLLTASAADRRTARNTSKEPK